MDAAIATSASEIDENPIILQSVESAIMPILSI